jgi:hypothetical protein
MPAKFGNNKESVDWLRYRVVNIQKSIMENHLRLEGQIARLANELDTRDQRVDARLN